MSNFKRSNGHRGGNVPFLIEEDTALGKTIIRRLLPEECEKLQAFPPGWTDIGTWVDSNGKVRKTSDTARYKALGNSIAIPQWYWIFKKMQPYLPENATLGSLFAGIGGFDLAFETIYGKGSSLWSSEIEEFPVAVLKRRFGGDDLDEKKSFKEENKNEESNDIDC